jgi:signal transduction histidine kinase
MSLFQRHRWFAAAAGITLVFAGVSTIARPGAGLTAFFDLLSLVLMLAALGITLANALNRRGPERTFWGLMALGFALWTCSQGASTYWEIVRHEAVPTIFFFDIILFIHAVPMIAAVAWRADLTKKEEGIQQSVLNFLMLLAWWIFLYAFIVFPHQYVVLDSDLYDIDYDRLFLLQNTLLTALLGLAAWTSTGGWRRVYLNFLGAAVLYGIGSQLLYQAARTGAYYSGSPYDIFFVGTLAWMAATALSAREWDMPRREMRWDPRWKHVVPRLAMLALLSLPVLGVWTALVDRSPAASRTFRISSVLTAMLLMGAFVFLRQYFQDQALVALLQESRRGYESQKRLQMQLVQKEKLATLGNLVAGAANEINHPLDAIMTYSEQLWGKDRITEDQGQLIRKIVNQARRTRDLVADLLRFAQQSPGEKIVVDLSMLLQRATQMLELKHPGGKIRVTLSIAKESPRVHGNANQLFQSFVEIIENAMDALEEAGGGTLEITAQRNGTEAVLQFSDTGPGVREPLRVFDPFYTTKPVGKGTGLGLSAVYGVIQEHSGQITCQNRAGGGAVFVIRIPAAVEPIVQVVGAGGD